MTASLVLLVSACKHNHPENSAEKADEHSHSENEILLEEEDAARFGVEVEKVAPSEFSDVVRVAGEILPSAVDKSTVSAPTSGIVTFAPDINAGATIQKGQTLATVRSNGVSGGDANAAAKAALDAAKRELDRVEPLLADGLITKKEYNDALAAYESARAAYSPQAAGGVARASRSGVITTLAVSDGAYVETGQAIAETASSNELTLRALLPASEAAFLPMIKSAVITPHGGKAISLDSIGGRLLSARSDGSAQTPGYIPVYFSLRPTDGSIVAGSAMEVYLTSVPRDRVISVPAEAITEQMGKHFVFVRLSGHSYEKRMVETGRNNGLRVEIKSGLQTGDLVVSRGATFIRLAQQATVVPEGHSHTH